MKVTLNNQAISRLLQQVAAALEVQQADRFRIIAYQRAAVAVEHATAEIKDWWDEGRLTDVPGIGKALATHLDELFRTGKVRHFASIFRGLPPAMFVFLDLSGVGAKTAYKLCKELGIKRATGALARLETAAKAGKVRQLEDFGEQSEKDLLQALAALKKPAKKRMRLVFADQLAQKIINYLARNPAVLKIDPLGSLRRQTATVGDIDIAVATQKPQTVIKNFVSFPGTKKILIQGSKTARIVLATGQQVDLKTQSPDAYGALLQHFTGSKQHNIHLREIAQKKGWSLSEYGLKREAGTKKFADEKSLYQALGMPWIPPELREDTGEIEASLKHQLPKLIQLNDIKGDLHLHSDFKFKTSHDLGESPMDSMVKKAREIGYEYLGFSEHNPSTTNTQKQMIKIIRRKKETIDKLNYSMNKNTQKQIKILNGLEIDIKTNGQLAVSDEALKLLDYAIASVHAHFQMSPKAMTARLLAGLNHPKVKILGHPTGRQIGTREGYEADWEKIFSFCRQRDIWLEINAWPERLDLPDFLVREAVKNGVKLIINSDSHALSQLDLLPYGVAVARRGWAQPKDIINTLPWSALSVRLKPMKGGESTK
ncbi:hypothetical protein COU97_00980 [Candidatus Shapirobacteria bacterium CG10_big_fil_rev_8_21_14_0_10_48_15]|uniref:DNA-directed DNA polymerase X domain-containing protein n=1 Tax=Candidatus Shapirobacteria bacterium CG10_big_fil_rev_8_21_14_0_10_48_15 TaxID=1974484 RepID=A0A2M8L7I3_9BACT|nr:MAG: hypothetical protein COU97_00980 [Candidatus Shapirobacteria bacterium CG10_big_fil_rev_8_21_14_0_10_48_15]